VPKNIFISHASADFRFLDPFVSQVIQLGCDVQPSDLFYSSGADTGVPDGDDLFAHVRQEVGSATLVVALITPMYLSRPVCMAELGAAWGFSEKLFPLLAPGMKRGDLDGILPSLLIRYVDDRNALDALHDRIGVAIGKSSKASTWSMHSTPWLATVAEHSATLQQPRVATIAEMETFERQLKAAESAVVEQEEEIQGLNERLAAVVKLKDKADVAPLLLPTDQQERLEALVETARAALREVNPQIVREAIRCEAAGIVFYSQDDDWAPGEMLRARDDGYLVEGYLHGEVTLLPDPGFFSHTQAAEAVKELMNFIEADADGEVLEGLRCEVWHAA